MKKNNHNQINAPLFTILLIMTCYEYIRKKYEIPYLKKYITYPDKKICLPLKKDKEKHRIGLWIVEKKRVGSILFFPFPILC